MKHLSFIRSEMHWLVENRCDTPGERAFSRERCDMQQEILIATERYVCKRGNGEQ
jgi:hypothetical protein